MDSKTLYCYRSGLPLLTVSPISTAAWPLVTGPAFKQGLLHPIYSQPLVALNKRLNSQITECEAAQWLINDQLATDTALSMSAIMWAMGVMWQPEFLSYADSRAVQASSSSVQLEPSLPHAGILAGTAIRLLDISTWYAGLAARRDYFPVWRVSRAAGNLNWHGFAGWCDICMDTIESFEDGKLRNAQAELMRERADALRTVNSAHVMKRLDYNKVWNWVDIQLAMGGIATGRRATWKSLFVTGDARPEDWLVDDIEDLQYAICEHVDIGNTITGFITQRLRHIKSLVTDFYDGFTVISSAPSAAEALATSNTMSAFHGQLDQLTTAPSAPDRLAYATQGAYLKAMAQFNILTKLWNAKQAAPAKPAGAANAGSSVETSVSIDQL